MAEENQKTNKINYQSIFITLIALFSPAAYIIGVAYHQGRLEGYGIDPSSFDFDVYSAYMSFYSISSYLASYIIISLMQLMNFTSLGISIGFYVIVSLLFFCLIKLIKSDKEKFKTIRSIKFLISFKENDIFKSLSLAGSFSYIILLLIYIVLSFSVAWCFTPYYAYNKGKELAYENIDSYIKNGCKPKKDYKWSDCVSVYNTNDKIILSGLFITRDNNQIAIFNGEKTIVSKLPDGYKIINTLK